MRIRVTTRADLFEERSSCASKDSVKSGAGLIDIFCPSRLRFVVRCWPRSAGTEHSQTG